MHVKKKVSGTVVKGFDLVAVMVNVPLSIITHGINLTADYCIFLGIVKFAYQKFEKSALTIDQAGRDIFVDT